MCSDNRHLYPHVVFTWRKKAECLLASRSFQWGSDLLYTENEEATDFVPQSQHHLCIVQAQFTDGQIENPTEPSIVLVTMKTDRKGEWRAGL